MQDIMWQILIFMGLIGGGFFMGFVCGREQLKDEFLYKIRQLKSELEQERKKYLDIIG